MKQKTRKWNPVTRSHTRVSKNKCRHERFQCGLTHSWIIKLASRVGFPTLNSDYKARILKTRGVRWRFTRAWSSIACVTGALWAKRGERSILRKARNECEALFFSSPRFAKNATFPSLSLGPGSALEEKRKKICERSESFLAFFARWGAWSQASLAWLIRSHKAPVSYAG